MSQQPEMGEIDKIPESPPRDADGSLRVCTPDPTEEVPVDRKRTSVVRAKLIDGRRMLPGLRDGLDVFVDEIGRSLAAERRMKSIASSNANATAPSSVPRGWDPLRTIARLSTTGNREEATWLAFLTTHLGAYGSTDPWASVRSLYSGFGEGSLTWPMISRHPSKIDDLSRAHLAEFERLRFGNHRKYESRDQLGEVVASYVDGIRRLANGSQVAFFTGYSVNGRPAFGQLMHALAFVHQFGRLARYDFLCLLGNLDVYELMPDRLYLEGATGPLRGARLMFGLDDPNELDRRACDLAGDLGISVQVMEDALCNWQKHL